MRKLKKTILHGLSIPNPNLSEFAIFGKKICRLGIVDFNLPSNSWVSLPQKTEFAVLFLGFEKLVLELDNCGGQPKPPIYCHIYSLWVTAPHGYKFVVQWRTYICRTVLPFSFTRWCTSSVRVYLHPLSAHSDPSYALLSG
jgi:hypothetical protein